MNKKIGYESPGQADSAMARNNISMEANLAGGLEAQKCVQDPAFMAKPNWPGELAARVYSAMQRVP